MPALPCPTSRRLPRRRTAALTTALTLLVTGLAACAPQMSDGGPAAAPSPAAHTSATRDDPEFEETFRHEFASVDGVRMHYVTGGSGTPVVLLHGWPQTWFGWWSIMPELAERHTVYAVDLPGLGDSTGAPTGYDKATLARYVHTLVADRLGVRDAHVVGHDLGAAVAFQYAAQFPADTASLSYLDLPLPGPALDARTYSRAEALTGGFELYRSLDQDVRDTTATDPVNTPTLLLTAQGQLDPVLATTSGRLTNVVRATDVPGAGHWLVEENPEFVAGELLDFLDE